MRFEAWTPPWLGLARKIVDIPAVSGRGIVRYCDFGDAQISVPADYADLSLVISDTVSSLIRAYEDSTIVQEFLAERVEHRIEESGTADISGGDLATVFDRVIVYPFDYPTNKFPDHIWGGRNLLQNPGFEDGTPRPEIVAVVVTAGPFTIGDGTDATSNITLGATALTVETRLEADITAIDDVLVTGAGTAADPYVIEFVTPSFGVVLTLDSGTGTLTRTQTGSIQPTGWTRSQTVSVGSGRIFGEYTDFGIVSSSPDTGTYCLYIDPALIGRPYAGGQQVISVTPGGTYQVSGRIRPDSATDVYRSLVRGIDEDFLASDTGDLGQTSYSAGAYSTVSIADVNVGDNSQVILRVSNVDESGNPSPFRLDNWSFTEGQAPATVGTIVISLMDDASVDHAADPRGVVLDWIDYSGFSATLDSSGAAWPGDISFTAHRGMSYGQVFDALVQLGYEWTLTPKATPVGALTHNLNWYGPGLGGTVRNAAGSPAINSGDGGAIVKRIPLYTAVLSEGGNDLYLEDSDATAEAAFGRFETYTANLSLGSTASLQALIDAELGRESANRTAVSVEITNPSSKPLVDYQVGDTINFQLPPHLSKTARRVRMIGWEHGDTPKYRVTGSRVFDQESGAWEAIRLILRRFNPLRPELDPTAAVLGGGGGVPRVVIAAADASAMSQSKADFQASGVNDIVTLDQAAAGLSGEIRFTEGAFAFTSSTYTFVAGTYLSGAGEGATLLTVNGSTDWTFDGDSGVRFIGVTGGGGV